MAFMFLVISGISPKINLKQSVFSVVDVKSRAYPTIGLVFKFERWHIRVFMDGCVIETSHLECSYKHEFSAQIAANQDVD